MADAHAFADREELEVVAEYSDENASAWSGNRGPELEAAMAHAERIAPCSLICQHTDRLARGDGRQARHLGEIYFCALRRDITLRSVQDDANLEDAIHAVLIGERNTEDSKRKAQAVRSGKQRQRERGERLGGPFPDGYLPDGNIDQERRPVIERMFLDQRE